MNKIRWNINQGSKFFIQENVFQNVACRMAAILSGPQWVKSNLYPQLGYATGEFQAFQRIVLSCLD